MIRSTWNYLTAGSTTYERGSISNPGQATAAAAAEKLEAFADSVAVSFQALDETPGDKNAGNPGCVYGEVSVPGEMLKFTGSCQLGPEGRVKSLEAKSSFLGSGDHLSVTTQGADYKEIHRTSMYEGSGSIYDCGPRTMETHEWAIFDGHQVSYKTYCFFTDKDPGDSPSNPWSW